MNFATRVVTGIKKFEHVSRARDDLGLLIPRVMCDLRTANVAYKTFTSGKPDSLADLFRTYAAARTCDRATRQDLLIRPPCMKTATGQRAFAYRASCLLNTLPDEIKGLTPSAFKRAARRFLTGAT